MIPLVTLSAPAAPIDGRNVDTDQIIPARFLKADRGQPGGYAPYLFHDIRRDAQGNEADEFVLNRPRFRNAGILVAEHNFGCGSSREGAVYALADSGFRAVIAPSFGDIFFNNCLKNGLLPVRLDEHSVAALIYQLHHADDVAQTQVDIDLESQTVRWQPPGGVAAAVHAFEIDPFWRECLLKGVDEVELTLSYRQQIGQFESRYLIENPWIQAT